jgi:hypothetical protein
MKTRILSLLVAIVLILGAIPAWMSYRVDQSLNHYIPAAKHVYLFESNDCEANLTSWIAFDIQYILEIMQSTQKEFSDTAHLDRLLTDKAYLVENQPRLEELIAQFMQFQDQYTADTPPYFCNTNVAEIHDAVVRMGDRNIFVYVAIIAQDNDKAKSRLQGLDDVMAVILGAMAEDPQLKPIMNRIIDSAK